MKIVVGYDGSNCAKEAIKLAVRHGRAFGARIQIVTSMVRGTENEQQEIKNAEHDLGYARSLVEKEGIDCRTHLLIRGLSPGEDLVAFAAENAAAEIIVGVKRRSRVGKLLLGSTAQFVILKADCPVVTVR